MRITTLAAGAIVLLAAAGCSSATDQPTADTRPATAPPAAAATHDRSTLTACQEAQTAADTDDQARALLAARAARRAAFTSGEADLQGIAKKHTDSAAGVEADAANATAAGYAIAAWCISHDVKTKP